MNKTILITGGNGYLARNLSRLFEYNRDTYNVISLSHSDLDLLDREKSVEYINHFRLDAIIHTASVGGHRDGSDTFENTYVPNLKMYENLESATDGMNIPIILFGSGAEFDRRSSINNISETEVFNRWPLDPYGASKNIICKRALNCRTKDIYVLRLFGCFNHDELDFRFIKRSILNIKNGLPIEIHRNRMMDFFYMDDLYTVVDYILNPKIKNSFPRNINLTYNHKYDLIGMSQLIQPNSTIKLLNETTGPSYTGNSNTLYSLPIVNKFIGLEEGIRRTVENLKI